MNRAELSALYAKMAAVYNCKPLSPEAMDTIYDMFEPYTFEEGKAGLKRWISMEAVAPKPAQLRVAIRVIRSMNYEPKHFDGEPVYQCPYCKDSGMMEININGEWVAAECVHTKAVTFARFKTTGSFRFKSRRYNAQLIWNPGGWFTDQTEPEKRPAVRRNINDFSQFELPF